MRIALDLRAAFRISGRFLVTQRKSQGSPRVFNKLRGRPFDRYKTIRREHDVQDDNTGRLAGQFAGSLARTDIVVEAAAAAAAAAR